MAHFAKIGMNSKVIQVTTMDNEVMKDSDGNEVEANGQQWLETHNNWPSQMWIQTSYNTVNNTHKDGGTPFRGNYAGIGYTWDEENNIFLPIKPYASWIKDLSTASWISPIGDATDLTATKTSQNKAGTHKWVYSWNEETTAWDLTDKLA